MSRSRIREFEAGDLDEAAGLLAARHRRHQQALPTLADVDGPAAVEREWEASDGGLVGVDGDGSVAAYLIWQRRENPSWGRHAWLDRAGHASRSAELTRDLYAVAAGGWVADGYLKHGVMVPAVTEDLDPWERLAFARMQVYALRELTATDGDAHALRQSRTEQVEEDVRPFAAAIWQRQVESPVFTGLTVPLWDDGLRADWIETLEEPGAVLLVADGDDGPIGHTLVYPADAALGWPEATARFAVAAVSAAHRGRGVGRTLAEASFAEARRAGFTHVETDWRVTNLEASRAWPAMGFVPAFHRLWRVTGTG